MNLVLVAVGSAVAGFGTGSLATIVRLQSDMEKAYLEEKEGVMSHTQEPWKTDFTHNFVLVSNCKTGKENYLIADCHPDESIGRKTQAKQNAIRIVAAVNAVAGIPTEQLRQLRDGRLARLYAEQQPTTAKEKEQERVTT